MKKPLLLLSITLIAISACKQKAGKKTDVATYADEVMLTTLAIKATVEPDTMFKKMTIEMQQVMLKPIANYKPAKKEIDSMLRRIDTLKKNLDTSKIYLLISDTLSRLPPDYLAKYYKNQPNDLDIDSTGRLIKTFWKEIKIDTVSTRINKRFKSPYNYKCIFEGNVNPSLKPRFIAGRFAMSVINFNTARNNAFIYTTYSCGSLCGSRQDLYFEKKGNTWRLVRRVGIWVS